jgi:hypothetical protein
VPNIPTPMPENSNSVPAPIHHCYPLGSQQTANNIAVFPKAHAANSVTDPITGQVQEFRHLMMVPNRATWMHSFANKLGQLAQGLGNPMPSGNHTYFLSPSPRFRMTKKSPTGALWPPSECPPATTPTFYLQVPGFA